MKHTLQCCCAALALVFFLAPAAFSASITVDGTPDAAWGDADVARSPDASTDAPDADGAGGAPGDENANILDCYVTDDGTDLYLRVDVAGSVLGVVGNTTWYELIAYIDSDNDAATGAADHFGTPLALGADYRVYLNETQHGSTTWGMRQLQQWDGSAWVATTTVPTLGISSSNPGVLEIELPLTDVGSPAGTMALTFLAIAGSAGDFNNDVNNSASAILYTVGSASGITADGVLGDWDGSELTATDADDNDSCIPETLDFHEVGVTSDDDNLYVRMTMDDIALWDALATGAYKEYRIWLDVDPLTTIGYQPYIDTVGCEGDETCIHWPDFYADYHVTINTWGTVAETINDKCFLDCSEDDCSNSANLIPANEGMFTAANGYTNIEFVIPRENIPGFDPDCFELTFTTYDTNSLYAGCTTPGDNLPDYGTVNGIGITTGCEDMIQLGAFTAVPGNGRVRVEWTTKAEVENAGFNVYRAEAADGPYERITPALVPAQGAPTMGADYAIDDDGLQNRTTYYYLLEDVALDGTVTRHGPVSARPLLLYGLGR